MMTVHSDLEFDRRISPQLCRKCLLLILIGLALVKQLVRQWWLFDKSLIRSNNCDSAGRCGEYRIRLL